MGGCPSGGRQPSRPGPPIARIAKPLLSIKAPTSILNSPLYGNPYRPLLVAFIVTLIDPL